MWILLSLLFSLPALALDGRFEGTVSLSNCSGFVFTTPDIAPYREALVMTNGHCLTSLMGGIILRPGEARIDRPGSRTVEVVNDQGKKLKFNTTRLVYATMTGTDMAIYRLPLTYSELAVKGVRPFSITSAPVLAESVEVYSAYKNSAHSCTIEHITNTREGGFPFTDTLRLSKECRQSNGSSGSPVVRTGTREVIAINNSYNQNGKACGNNNPCEVSGDEVIVNRGARYAQQIVGLLECFESSEFLISCPLIPSAPVGLPAF